MLLTNNVKRVFHAELVQQTCKELVCQSAVVEIRTTTYRRRLLALRS